MRKAGAVSAKVFAFAGSLVEPGITTDEIDALSHEFACALDAYPSPLGYAGFPKSLCTSVNEVVCHGIPDRYTHVRLCGFCCCLVVFAQRSAPLRPSPACLGSMQHMQPAVGGG